MITVVSGLPRSGTSMMMQMLERGGMTVLTDRERVPDEDNPRGYCEYEPVKKLKADASWMPEAEGKVVKIISMLLFHLPPEHEYQVVFMKRPVAEVLASQARMLERKGMNAGQADDARLREHFESHLESVAAWLRQQPNIQVHYCSYRRVVDDPGSVADEVADFLGLDLDRGAMMAAVDPKLHRQRS